MELIVGKPGLWDNVLGLIVFNVFSIFSERRVLFCIRFFSYVYAP